ncbi:MAG: imidazole glycerol phosphate synthase subunit HisH [Bacteroidetes bacterium]|nr:MAG: imidazole glycerol phosphate synthase subunit HisH [Bacteroidota bacterium]
MIAVIDYNAGNIRSVMYALDRLGAEAVLTSDPAQIRAAEKVIFPGVGQASTTMAWLQRHGLDALIRSLTQPVLGICLGMQLLCAHSEEGDTPCLGVVPARVRRFVPARGEKVPHMGWNTIRQVQGPLFEAADEVAWMYFVHSYYVETGPWTIAETDYVLPFSAAIRHDNFFATQFHPEKSGEAGMNVLRRFLAL